MNNPVVLDACTIVNLARIDEDCFLEDQMRALKTNAVSTVLDEVKAHYEPSDKASKRQLHVPPYWGGLTKHDDTAIAGETDKVRAFSDYTKKSNGELYSTALSLVLSRCESEKVLFYTDDFPAKDDFLLFFDFQQIGYIGDSVDLLIFLYWKSPSGTFSGDELKKYLTALRGEYAKMQNKLQAALNGYARKLTGSKKELRRKFAIEGLANDLKGGKELNTVVNKCIKQFENDRSEDGKKIMDIINGVKSSPKIVEKIDGTVRNINQYGIYK